MKLKSQTLLAVSHLRQSTAGTEPLFIITSRDTEPRMGVGREHRRSGAKKNEVGADHMARVTGGISWCRISSHTYFGSRKETEQEKVPGRLLLGGAHTFLLSPTKHPDQQEEVDILKMAQDLLGTNIGVG